jgi:hypothetical protein
MPKFLAGCHYNEEEISRHLRKNIEYWPVQFNGNKFGAGQILKEPVEVVTGRILAGWAQKSPEPRSKVWFVGVEGPSRVARNLCPGWTGG